MSEFAIKTKIFNQGVSYKGILSIDNEDIQTTDLELFLAGNNGNVD